jgi:hypothetical protein
MDEKPKAGDILIQTRSMTFYRRTRFLVLENDQALPISETTRWEATDKEETPIENAEPVPIILGNTGDGPKYLIRGSRFEILRYRPDLFSTNLNK